MRKTKILTELENFCKKLSIFVKYDRFFGRGGYCRLRDKSYFIINKRLSNEIKEQIFIDELKLINVNTIDLPAHLKMLFDEK